MTITHGPPFREAAAAGRFCVRRESGMPWIMDGSEKLSGQHRLMSWWCRYQTTQVGKNNIGNRSPLPFTAKKVRRKQGENGAIIRPSPSIHLSYKRRGWPAQFFQLKKSADWNRELQTTWCKEVQLTSEKRDLCRRFQVIGQQMALTSSKSPSIFHLVGKFFRNVSVARRISRQFVGFRPEHQLHRKINENDIQRN